MNRWIGMTALLLACCAFLCAADNGTTKETYVKKAGQEIQGWNAKADQLQKKAETAGADTRRKLDHFLRIIRRQLEAARQTVTDLNGSTGNGWKQFRQKADEALGDVKQTYHTATTFLNKNDQ